MYDFTCSGHFDKWESHTRAFVREEIVITLKEEELEFSAINHHYQADHVQLFFIKKFIWYVKYIIE